MLERNLPLRRVWRIALLATAAANNIVAAPAGSAKVHSVTVCVEKASAVEAEVLDRAEISAGQILALAGVKLDWRNPGRSCPTERDPIILDVTTDTPKAYFPQAYGEAFAFEGIHIRAFYDRIRQTRPEQIVPLLAHVLAHEIVHILSGTDSHSETGVMKLRWSQSDLQQMVIRPLPFSKLDVLLLNLGIRDRHARLAATRKENLVSTAGLPTE